MDGFYIGTGNGVNGKMFSVYLWYGGFIFLPPFKKEVPIIFTSFFLKRS
jgi:hypothetical protein